MSFEIDALFDRNILTALIIPFLEIGLKEKNPFPKCFCINLKRLGLSACRSFRSLVTLVKRNFTNFLKFRYSLVIFSKKSEMSKVKQFKI